MAPDVITPATRARRDRGRRPRPRAVALALVLAWLVCSGTAAATDSLGALMRDFGVGPLSGEPASVALPSLAGERVTLQNHRGRLVMLYFWATWCPFCTREMPTTLQAIHREFHDQGLTV